MAGEDFVAVVERGAEVKKCGKGHFASGEMDTEDRTLTSWRDALEGEKSLRFAS